MAHTRSHMHSRTRNGFFAFGAAITLFICSSTTAIAQSTIDVEPPIIEVELVADAPADQTQVFTAQVTDDKALGEVTLHVRRSGTAPFEKLVMKPITDTGYYSLIIDTDPNDTRAFEFLSAPSHRQSILRLPPLIQLQAPPLNRLQLHKLLSPQQQQPQVRRPLPARPIVGFISLWGYWRLAQLLRS